MVSFNDVRFMVACSFVLFTSFARPKNHYVSFSCSILILWIAYGLQNLCFILFAITLNISLIAFLSKRYNEYSAIATNLILLYFYKLFGTSIEPELGGTFDISGFLMVLTVKMSYAARDISSIKKTMKSRMMRKKDKRQISINFAATLLVLEYILFPPGLLSGPTPTFAEFFERNRFAPSTIPYPRIVFIIAYLCIYAIFRNFPFLDLALNSKTPYLLRLVYLYLYNVVMRAKFHYIWNFADFCFHLYNFHDQLNIDFVKVELAQSVSEISTNWNKFVNRWLREMFFTPIRKHSFILALAACYLFSAVLHGINPCYLLFSFSFGFYNHVIARSNRFIKSIIIRRIITCIFVSYFSIPFFLLDFKKVILIWKAVGFIGTIYCTGLFLLFSIYDLLCLLRKLCSKAANEIPTIKEKTE